MDLVMVPRVKDQNKHHFLFVQTSSDLNFKA